MKSTPEVIKQRFSNELSLCCRSRYKTIPSNEQFARDFHLSSKYVLKVSRETVRKWFRGDSFPDLDHLLHLIEWIGLDMTKVFVDEPKLKKSKDAFLNLKNLGLISVKSITPEQIDSFVCLLNSIKSTLRPKNQTICK